MLGPRGKSRDNPGHFQPLHLQSFPHLEGVVIVNLNQELNNNNDNNNKGCTISVQVLTNFTILVDMHGCLRH